MPLVNAKCTNCGANLSVDNAKEAAVCSFCGSAFIVEQAINNYNITNNIKADVVNVYGGTADFEIRAGVLLKYNGVDSDVVIPDTVKKIDKKAFQGCEGLTSIVIPASVSTVDAGIFDECSELCTVKISSAKIGEKAFKDCENIENAEIDSAIIGEEAFCGCKKLCNVKLGKKVRSIGDRAFMYCGELTELVLSSGIESIGEEAFCCTGLQKVYLPETINHMGARAFEECENLEIAEIDSANIGEDAFRECEELCNIKLGNSVKTIGEGAFMCCTKIKKLKLPDGIETIGDGAFSSTSIERINLPNSLKYIGDGAFDDSDIKEIVFPHGITRVESNVCSECIELESVIVPNTVKEIGYSAFYYCISLKKIVIPEGVEVIEEDAFCSCESLSEIVIPNSLKVFEQAMGKPSEDEQPIRIIASDEWLRENYFLMPEQWQKGTPRPAGAKKPPKAPKAKADNNSNNTYTAKKGSKVKTGIILGALFGIGVGLAALIAFAVIVLKISGIL